MYKNRKYNEKETIENVLKYMPHLYEQYRTKHEPMSVHLRVSYDTYLNLVDDYLTLEYIHKFKPPVATIYRAEMCADFKKCYMTKKQIIAFIEWFTEQISSGNSVPYNEVLNLQYV